MVMLPDQAVYSKVLVRTRFQTFLGEEVVVAPHVAKLKNGNHGKFYGGGTKSNMQFNYRLGINMSKCVDFIEVISGLKCTLCRNTTNAAVIATHAAAFLSPRSAEMTRHLNDVFSLCIGLMFATKNLRDLGALCLIQVHDHHGKASEMGTTGGAWSY